MILEARFICPSHNLFFILLQKWAFHFVSGPQFLEQEEPADSSHRYTSNDPENYTNKGAPRWPTLFTTNAILIFLPVFALTNYPNVQNVVKFGIDVASLRQRYTFRLMAPHRTDG